MNKNIKVIIMVVISIFGIFFVLRFAAPEDAWICTDGQWVRHGNPSSSQPQNGCGENMATEDIDFDEVGHFVKDNPGLKPGVWYLIYEKPGAAALSAELIFDDKSVCTWGGERGPCPEVFLPRSSLTRVRGVLTQDGAVRVTIAS